MWGRLCHHVEREASRLHTIYALLTKMVADWFTGREISTAMGVMLSSWPVGIGVALATLGAVATRWSWRASLLITAGAAAAGLLLLGALYRSPAGLASSPREPVRLGLDLPPWVWALAASAGLCWTALNASFIVVASFGPTFLIAQGASVAEAGSLVSMGIWSLGRHPKPAIGRHLKTGHRSRRSGR